MIGVDWSSGPDQAVVTVARHLPSGKLELRMFTEGTAVQFKSLCSERVFYGRIVGFLKDGMSAVCTDQTGLPPRAVSVARLTRAPPSYRSV